MPETGVGSQEIGGSNLEVRADQVDKFLQSLVAHDTSGIPPNEWQRVFLVGEMGKQARLHVILNYGETDRKKPNGSVHLRWVEDEGGQKSENQLEYYNIVTGKKRVFGVPTPFDEVNFSTSAWKATPESGPGRTPQYLGPEQEISAWERWIPQIKAAMANPTPPPSQPQQV